MNEKLATLYFEVTNLWKEFCEEHNELFNLTCDEYSLLMQSNLELLDDKLIEKNECIKRINTLELVRRNLIKEVADLYENKKIEGVSDLLEVMSEFELEK